MKILLIDNISKHIQEIYNLFSKNDIIETINFTEIDKINDLNYYDLIILSGGKPSRMVSLSPALKESFITQQLELITNSEVPIIGICYGFKLINISYNSKLEYHSSIIKGIKPIKLQTNFWKNSKDSLFNCHEEHHYVTKRLGRELISLGNSSRGIEIVKHKDKLIFGLQFHPEINPTTQKGDEIFNYILEYIKLKIKINPTNIK